MNHLLFWTPLNWSARWRQRLCITRGWASERLPRARRALENTASAPPGLTESQMRSDDSAPRQTHDTQAQAAVSVYSTTDERTCDAIGDTGGSARACTPPGNRYPET